MEPDEKAKIARLEQLARMSCLALGRDPDYIGVDGTAQWTWEYHQHRAKKVLAYLSKATAGLSDHG